MGRVYSRYLFFLKLVWDNKSELEKYFGFRLIMDFRVNFWVVRDHEYILQGV